MSYTIVRSFFNTAMTAWASAQSPVVLIAKENSGFTPPSSGSWAETFLMPAATLTATIRADRFREVGIFQINLYTKAGIGTALQDTLVQSLINAFPLVPTGVVSIESQPYATKIDQNLAGWAVVAISVNYRYES